MCDRRERQNFANKSFQVKTTRHNNRNRVESSLFVWNHDVAAIYWTLDLGLLRIITSTGCTRIQDLLDCIIKTTTLHALRLEREVLETLHYDQATQELMRGYRRTICVTGIEVCWVSSFNSDFLPHILSRAPSIRPRNSPVAVVSFRQSFAWFFGPPNIVCHVRVSGGVRGILPCIFFPLCFPPPTTPIIIIFCKSSHLCAEVIWSRSPRQSCVLRNLIPSSHPKLVACVASQIWNSKDYLELRCYAEKVASAPIIFLFFFFFFIPRQLGRFSCSFHRPAPFSAIKLPQHRNWRLPLIIYFRPEWVIIFLLSTINYSFSIHYYFPNPLLLSPFDYLLLFLRQCTIIIF